MAFTVILGYDGSKCADAALQAAADEVQRAGGGTVVVVHSYETPEPYATPVGLEPPPYIGVWSDDQRDAVRQAAGAVTSGAVERLRELGTRAEGVAAEGAPWRTLIDEAKRRSAAMIIVGTHGEGAVAGALLGSTAYRLVHHSPVPVLIVPPVDRC
jgi:nucleotide-binding universal stress UspA family protein